MKAGEKKPAKPWAGRFGKDTDKFVEDFTTSLPFDRRLYRYDIEGSLAHVSMLGKCDILPEEDVDRIKTGLGEIFREIQAGEFQFDNSDEDIHMAIERALIDKIGPSGGKLHTARSRNDQIAVDLRLFLKEQIFETAGLLRNLQETIVGRAEDGALLIMPGYTHLQRAQPVLFAHHLMAYFFMLTRDFSRLKDCFGRTDELPLGSAALAGTTHPIDREYLAEQLGFAKVSENSMDAVSDRDFVLEFLACASITMAHLSRLAEEIILWSSSEFGFVELDDSYATGSSIMPQKKNPDVAELVRGKTGRVFGDLMQLLTVLKGLPLAYNRDLQEDKESLFDAADTVKASLVAMTGLVSTLKVNEARMREAAGENFTEATDVADYLVSKGVPFREAHEVAGNLVKLCLSKKCNLASLSLDDYKQFNRAFEADLWDVLGVETSVRRRDSQGGTSPRRVREQLEKAKKILEEQQACLDSIAG